MHERPEPNRQLTDVEKCHVPDGYLDKEYIYHPFVDVWNYCCLCFAPYIFGGDCIEGQPNTTVCVLPPTEESTLITKLEITTPSSAPTHNGYDWTPMMNNVGYLVIVVVATMLAVLLVYKKGY